ncbi:MAG: DUF4445 domain-containing protein [Anaerolineae bacterium]|nr:DUF4445 domain-containing protein [Anaerolineae bacterium]
MNKTLHIDLEPVGRRADVAPGTTVLEATQSAGIALVAVCGGVGVCGKCRVRLMAGELSPLTEAEADVLGDAAVRDGLRLACMARALTDVKIYVPPESLTTTQRLQVEGQETEIALDPIVIPVDVTLTTPTLDDLRADTVRLADALAEQNIPRPYFDQPVLSDLSDHLRTHNWSVRLALRREDHGFRQGVDEVAGVLPPGDALLGMAVDIGTTKMAVYLVDLNTGHTLAKAGIPNPQVAYGEDVVSRIAYANEHTDGRQVLQFRLIESLNTTLDTLCQQAGVVHDQVVEAVVVGNTAMHHLFAGLPVRQLGAAPYLASASEPLDICACHLGLKLASGAKVYMPPNIAGYVGADHVSMLLATGVWTLDKPTVALDIGTNTEMSLVTKQGLLSCSCASGPAFEGAHIHDGMRAAPGAIERVQIRAGQIQYQTVENQPPVGICGSGILDAVAELYKAELLDSSGKLLLNHPNIHKNGAQREFLLVPAAETGHGRDILVTRKDVNEIQLAKGAIRAGIEVLLHEAGLTHRDLDGIIVAGAFGTYIDVENAVRVGMFPPLPVHRFQQVGNAAGIGAKQMLLSMARRELTQEIARRMNYIELTANPYFTDLFMQALMFAQS